MELTNTILQARMTAEKDIKDFILIKNSRVHNLKNLSVDIPRNKLTVVTGVSGSGKSSLAFDTLFAEGQRRYAESLSSYVRQFVGRMDKPDVDSIKGISPAIAIEQKVNTRNPRSTVGTSTEIYDYLKLLFARIGKTYSPISGNVVKRDTVTDVVEFIKKNKIGSKYLLLAPLYIQADRNLTDELGILMQKGFSRIVENGKIQKIEDAIKTAFASELVASENRVALVQEKKKRGAPRKKIIPETEPILLTPIARTAYNIQILIDRFAVSEEEDFYSRVADSVQTAFSESLGECILLEINDEGESKKSHSFSNRFEADNQIFEEPSVHLFSFNNPFGACKTCQGFGQVIGVDTGLVVPDENLSIFDGAIACWKGDKMSEWNDALMMHAYEFDFPVHRPYRELSEAQKKLIWTGNNFFKGLDAFFKFLEKESYKIQYRVMLSRFRGRTKCTECEGTRLRKDANFVKVSERSISEIVLMQVKDAYHFFESIEEGKDKISALSKHDKEVAKRILIEIRSRLRYLTDVGLGYLTLNRLSNTLSGGESQRINLATALGSSLVGSMYILDEPSIGLHPRDTQRLIGILHALRDLGNTVIVVEHDEEIMRAADHLIDLGPGAGSLGGELLFEGELKNIFTNDRSMTAKYLSGEKTNLLERKQITPSRFIEVVNARENTLKNISVKFPIGALTVVTGVSGSGKSSLVKSILFPALRKMIMGYGEQPGKHDKILVEPGYIQGVEFVDQNPIGKSSRSNPVTYVKAYDEIRAFYCDLPLAKQRAYKPSVFSFNVSGGRCETCEGSGEMIIEMQFMADIHLRCESCYGKQFKDEILEVNFEGKNIYDVLQMTIDDAISFFEAAKTNEARKITSKLKPLQDVGLGYVKLGQSASTLSGGEAQRIKLASFFSKEHESGHTVFLFDEPTTGLHFHDINKLLYCFDRLVENGHTVIIIEHNIEVIRNADWVIDLGPEGGDTGGNIVFEGRPADLVNCKNSFTGQYLKL